jgi:hypothetical protein
VFGKNIDKSKVEMRAGMEHFFFQVFKFFYIAIRSSMKLDDVLEVLPMFMPKTFLGQFVFIWGHVNNAPKHLAKFPLGSIII